MDYEKKYKNALEWSRQVMNGETGFIRKEVEEIFPELKESEDEKVRKKLLALIEWSKSYAASGITANEAKEMIAWVEKKGEKDVRQKFLEDLLVADDIHQMSVNDAMVKEAKNKAIEALSKFGISKLLGLEKQGEQKPTDEEMKAILRTEYEKGRADAMAEVQKSAENSGKVSEYTAVEKGMGKYNKGFECGKQRVLKYPEDYGLCKKYAWSEEDKNHIVGIIQTIDFAIRRNSISKKTGNVQINWLKFLKYRCTWKPSDKQMDAVRIAAEIGTANNSWAMGVLKSMYQDLRKLREE